MIAPTRLLAAGLLSGATLLGSAGGIRAQLATPPDQPPQATGAPRALPGANRDRAQPQDQAGSDASEAPAGPSRFAPRPGILGHSGGAGVTVAALGEVEGPPTGTLDAASGGLGLDLWSGSSRAALEDLMSRLPLATTVAPLRALARRIVLTRATTPLGAADKAFMTVRVARLLDGGLLADAAALASLAQVKNDPGFARVQAEAILYAGLKRHVCDDTTSTRLDNAEPFWIELRAYCYAIGGDDAALALTRAVMQTQNIGGDAFDTLLADIRNGDDKAPDSIDAPNALHVFMLGELGLPVGFDSAAQLGTPALLVALRSARNSPQDRLKAAERVLPTGALSADEMLAIADAQSFTPDQFGTEHAQLRALPFLAGQALLRQAVKRAAADARPALIYEALDRADSKGLLGVAAMLQHDALQAVPPQPELHDMAALFGRALMMTGHSDAAERWAGLLDPKRTADRPTLARFAILLNLMAPNPDRQARAEQALSELADDLDAKRSDSNFAALALGLYAALDRPMPADARQTAGSAMATPWPGRRPAASTRKRLTAAMAAPGRKGEALMLVLDAMGPRGPSDLAPDAAADLIAKLMKLGVPGAARDLAITALLRYRPAAAPPSP